MNTLPPPPPPPPTTKLKEIEAMQKVEANLKIYNYYYIDEKVKKISVECSKTIFKIGNLKYTCRN